METGTTYGKETHLPALNQVKTPSTQGRTTSWRRLSSCHDALWPRNRMSWLGAVRLGNWENDIKERNGNRNGKSPDSSMCAVHSWGFCNRRVVRTRALVSWMARYAARDPGQKPRSAILRRRRQGSPYFVNSRLHCTSILSHISHNREFDEF
jgi:hypothetical protein